MWHELYVLDEKIRYAAVTFLLNLNNFCTDINVVSEIVNIILTRKITCKKGLNNNPYFITTQPQLHFSV